MRTYKRAVAIAYTGRKYPRLNPCHSTGAVLGDTATQMASLVFVLRVSLVHTKQALYEM
jgi:hypothetical protein